MNNDPNSANNISESELYSIKDSINENIDIDDETKNTEYNNLEHGNYNYCEMSANKNFDAMLEEMQNCLKDTAELRSLVRNISDDRSDNFIPIIQSDLTNSFVKSHRVDLIDTISHQKLAISVLERDKQALIYRINDLNNKVSELTDQNRKFKEELNIIKMKDADYYLQSKEYGGDNIIIHDSNQTEEEISISLPNYNPTTTNLTVNNDSQQRIFLSSFLQRIGFRDSTKVSACKSSSWSELRTNKIIQDETFLPTKHSGNNSEITTRVRSFSKNESKIYSADYKRRMALVNDKSDLKMWSNNQVCSLLHQIGLGAYTNNCQKWAIDGHKLIQSSRKEIEKEMNIKNKLHLKKLLLHIRRLTTMHVPAATSFSLARPNLEIASNFDIRLWLDDIGLLHYIGVFSANGLDGHMLDQISLEDLHHLKIDNELHSLSLKRGIQLLRTINYDLSLLVRRPSDNTWKRVVEKGSNGHIDVICNIPPSDVCLWTQHQVTEWLRHIELPEYASNIRGSGIHGALIIYEDRFTANTLASVLNIPHSRSLLRRHLNAKFHELIGPSIANKKHAATANGNLVSLSATSRIKFHRRKRLFDGIKRKPHYEPIEELLVSYDFNVDNIST